MKLHEKVSLIITGLLYISIGILVLIYPNLLYYGVAAAFLTHGIASLVRAWGKRDR
ncbi:MAG: hypothetical protein U9Q97_10195 [Acidobacteriota bacterium]|nr:hypothetical protein [Acidobacteriota bacterium]